MFNKFQFLVVIFLVVFSLGIGIIFGQDIKKEKIITITDTQILTTTIVKEVQPAPQPINCMKGESYFYIEETDSFIKLGESEICGINLSLGNTVGPSYDIIIANLENDLSRWKDCALYQSCTKEMLVEKK